MAQRTCSADAFFESPQHGLQEIVLDLQHAWEDSSFCDSIFVYVCI